MKISIADGLKVFILIYLGQKESSSELEKATEVAGSAILGALVSQEVIKSFSRKDNPINNLFILDLQNLKNSITRVGIIS